MPCGMELRRARNNLVAAVRDAYGDDIAPGAIGDVDPHDERVIAGFAAGDLTDLGPAGAAKAHTHEHEEARRP